jgi:hypothetical protein
LFDHVFVDISRSQGCKKTPCKNAKTKGQNRARKGKKKTPSDEPTVPQIQASVQSSDELVHRVKPYVPSDEPTVSYLVASDELQKKSKEDSSTG